MRQVLLLIVSLSLLASVVPAADEAPALLQYRFVAGQVIHSESTGQGTLPMTIRSLAGAGAGDVALDLKLDLRVVTDQACAGVLADGSGQIASTIPEMCTAVNMAMADQPVNTLTTWKNGLLTITVNGQPAPPDPGTQRLQQLLAAPLKSTMTPAGMIKLDPQSAQALQATSSFGMSSNVTNLTGALSPSPVKPGDTWTVELKPEDTGGQLEGDAQYKLAGYEAVGGVRCARIEGQARFRALQPFTSQSAGAPGQMTTQSLDVAVNFVNWFDPVAGCIVLSRLALAQNLTMLLDVGAGMPPVTMSIENAQMTMEMKRLSAAPGG